ncbi:MAG: serine/threonine-protein phosphatase [Betaproteobacteria bacterium]|nr:serine/threonine-protein phosphatase [Betaproteobacteria bacterium]MBI2961023.1 serine/threonine-protein phosphatase [Betaproteobacteria bacterium]
MKFSIYKESRQGARELNEDRLGYCYSRDALMMVVADGMGGHLHGEVAAQIAVQFLTEAFQCEAGPKLSDPFLFLLKNMTSAHHAIRDYAEVRGLLETPRTTCVAAIVQDSTAWWAHVGDSRLYHIRSGRIHSRTKDHSRVQMLIDQGRVREEAAGAHPERNKIFSCLGAIASPQIDLSRKVRLARGDTLLLCTDGLWESISARALCTELLRSDIMVAIPRLLDMAEVRAGEGCDNLSVIAMTWAGEGAEAHAEQVSTQTLEVNAFNTAVEEFGKPAAGQDHGDLSEEEIERAIAEIRNAIQKQTGK